MEIAPTNRDVKNAGRDRSKHRTTETRKNVKHPSPVLTGVRYGLLLSTISTGVGDRLFFKARFILVLGPAIKQKMTVYIQSSRKTSFEFSSDKS